MPERRLSFGPFEVDERALIVLRGGEPLPVGQRGVQLLAALLRRPGEVVTKAELIDAAWGGAAIEDSNLSVQVASLRRTLGATPNGGDWIATIPRVGYRFVASFNAATPASNTRPSIAVLPFENLSADPEQGFFADGLAEEVTTALSKLIGLRVAARNSSFAYRGAVADIRKVASELGVSHVLSGSVRRGGDRLRISVQLAEAMSGAQLWAERYDRAISDIFEVQDDVAGRIFEVLRIKLLSIEAANALAGRSTDMEIASRPHRPRTREALSLTPELVARVERLELDPGPDPGSADPTTTEIREMAEVLLSSAPRGPFWLFAYGSLIWKPELDTVLQQYKAVASGWHRSFCMRLTRGRGTREVPALMMALDRGGSCTGIAYRLPDEDKIGQLMRLLTRELDGVPSTTVPRWITARINGGPIMALAFVVDRHGPAYEGHRPHGEVAAVLARAAGHRGSSAAYLQRTVSKLDEYGIRDRNLWAIQRLVAQNICHLAP